MSFRISLRDCGDILLNPAHEYENFIKIMEMDAEKRSAKRVAKVKTASAFKERGNEAYAREDDESAVKYPVSSSLTFKSVQAYIKLGKYKEAISDCEWVLKVDVEEEKEHQAMVAKQEFDKGEGKATMVPQLLEKLSKPGQMPLYYCGGLEILSQTITDSECHMKVAAISLDLSALELSEEDCVVATLIASFASGAGDSRSPEEVWRDLPFGTTGLKKKRTRGRKTRSSSPEPDPSSIHQPVPRGPKWSLPSSDTTALPSPPELWPTPSAEELEECRRGTQVEQSPAYSPRAAANKTTISFLSPRITLADQASQMATVHGRNQPFSQPAESCLRGPRGTLTAPAPWDTALAVMSAGYPGAIAAQGLSFATPSSANGSTASPSSVLPVIQDVGAAPSGCPKDPEVVINVEMKEMGVTAMDTTTPEERRRCSASEYRDMVYSLLGLLMNLSTITSPVIQEHAVSLSDCCLDLLRDKDRGIITRATGVLSTTLPQSSKAIQHVTERGVIRTMHWLLKGTGQTATKYAIKTTVCTAASRLAREELLKSDKKLLRHLLSSSCDETVCGNAALCLTHSFELEGVASCLLGTDIGSLLLRHAAGDSERTAVQQNATIALWKLCSKPRHVKNLRELHGFEVLHPCMKLIS
ncbi:LOW QUALITY PROTEIN: tetratricopeptide repeat protein 12 [Pholidichthys leucotaenia]